MTPTHTRTFVTYFDPELVDSTIGAAYKALESDFERRREYISPEAQRAIEARLAFLRANWILLLDKCPD